MPAQSEVSFTQCLVSEMSDSSQEDEGSPVTSRGNKDNHNGNKRKQQKSQTVKTGKGKQKGRKTKMKTAVTKGKTGKDKNKSTNKSKTKTKTTRRTRANKSKTKAKKAGKQNRVTVNDELEFYKTVLKMDYGVRLSPREVKFSIVLCARICV